MSIEARSNAAPQVNPHGVTLDEIGTTPAYPTVLFGGAGSGKSHLAANLKERYGFVVFDDEDVFTSEEMIQLRGGQRFSMEQRKRYHNRTNDLLEQYVSPPTEHPKIVYINPFTKDRFRREFVQRFPGSLMVLVETPWEIHRARIEARNGSHHISSEVAIQSALSSERPISVPYVVYKNS